MLYVGSHWGDPLDGYVCSSKYMKDAYKKRSSDFMRRIVYWQITPNRKELLEVEQRWLALIPDDQLGERFYNLRNKISGQWQADDQTRMTIGEKISTTQRGVKFSPERCAAISAAKLGQVYKPMSEQGRANMRRTFSPEHRAKLGAAIQRRKERGWTYTHTPEARAKLSDALKGKVLSPAHRAAVSAALIGRTYKPRTGPNKPHHKTACPHCGIKVAPSPYARWHGDRCRQRGETG